jgi:DNA polymerase-1
MSIKKKLYLFDGSSYVYRAYYALPPLKTKDGFPTGAIFGFLRMLLAFLKEKNPTYAAVVFDAPKKTFRSELFKEYKAQRKPAPDDLKRQIPEIKKLVKLLGIPLLEVEGVEADDVIATLAKTFSQKGWKVIIYTPDKDMAQLLTFEGVKIINPLTEEEITPQKVEEKFGVKPHQIPSYLALVGDKVDNIPGVEGVGPKRAVEILQKVNTVEEMVKNWENLPPQVKKYLSKTSPEELKKWLSLVELKTDLELNLSEEDLKVKKPDLERLKEELRRLEMKSLLKELEKIKRSVGFGQRSLF